MDINLQDLILAAERLIEDRGLAHCQQAHKDGVPTGRRRWVNVRPELLQTAEDAIAASYTDDPAAWADLQSMAMATPQPWRAYFHSMDGPALRRFVESLKGVTQP